MLLSLALGLALGNASAQSVKQPVAVATGEFIETSITTGWVAYTISAEAPINYFLSYQSQDLNTTVRGPGVPEMNFQTTFIQGLAIWSVQMQQGMGIRIGGGSALNVMVKHPAWRS